MGKQGVVLYGARIETILSMMPVCRVAADIGTDHGLVAWGILNGGKAKKVIATDISAASLRKAQKYAAAHTISEMETRLGDGLAPLAPGEADAAVLTGMGGRLIARILGEGAGVAGSIPVFILQPMHSVRDLRHWLYEHEYMIAEERLAREGDRFYHVMRVIHGQDELTLPLHMEIGRQLIEDRDPLLVPYIEQLISKNEMRVREISKKDTPRTHAALLKCRALEKTYREVLDETNSW
jgi:tRNA (adenine22-N1)-methyltransferase